MSSNQNAQDPLEFVRGMWNNMGFSLPGMVTPTLDTDELEKRIADLKAVENWLKMNLNMLQMTIQGLEMQRVALAAVKAMSEHTQQSGTSGDTSETPGENPFASAMWPWNLMNSQSTKPAEAGTKKSRATASRKTGRPRKPTAAK